MHIQYRDLLCLHISVHLDVHLCAHYMCVCVCMITVLLVVLLTSVSLTQDYPSVGMIANLLNTYQVIPIFAIVPLITGGTRLESYVVSKYRSVLYRNYSTVLGITITSFN